MISLLKVCIYNIIAKVTYKKVDNILNFKIYFFMIDGSGCTYIIITMIKHHKSILVEQNYFKLCAGISNLLLLSIILIKLPIHYEVCDVKLKTWISYRGLV